MDNKNRQVTYQSTNTYETLNQVTHKTKNIWIVLHGIGYLSRYFINFFDELSADENFVIAPQAPSKYYLKNEYRYVGASWLTKENTVLDTQNVLAYLDAVYEAEDISIAHKLIIFGFSQGVSIATRWVAQRKLRCNQLILYAGGLPDELQPGDFIFLSENNTRVTVLVGDNDAYLNEERMKVETKKIETLFHGRAKQIIFKGGHEVKKELINQFG